MQKSKEKLPSSNKRSGTTFLVLLAPTHMELPVRKSLAPIPSLQADNGIKCLDEEEIEVIADRYKVQFNPH